MRFTLKSSLLATAMIAMLISTTVFAEDEPEIIHLKRRETRSHILLTPAGAAAYNTQEDKDLMPGNDSFGFFYKATNEKKGICRLRVKVVCDYGLELLKEQKNLTVKVQFNNTYYNPKTDLEGVLDLIFKCDSHRQNDGVMVTARKHMESSKLSEFPKEIRIPSDDCK